MLRHFCGHCLVDVCSRMEVSRMVHFFSHCLMGWLRKLGGKGSNLAEMAIIGLSVPPGFTISTEACQEYQKNGKTLPQGLWEEILEGLECMQDDMGALLGDPSKPLLLSVWSGDAISMPGMMDTALNLGLNDEVVDGLASKSG